MKSNTVIGIFESATEARQAVEKLAQNGFQRDFVDVSQASATPSSSDSNYSNSKGPATETKDGISGFFSSLFGDDKDTADTYAEVTRSGHSLVTVHVDTLDQAHKAADILDEAGALDVDSKAAEYGLATKQPNQAPAKTSGTDGMTAQVIEEKLEVGKRTEQTGGVRLRSRIVEKPVEASVRLREEHVSVQRTPVNRPATDADFKAFKEGDVTLTESAERAVVAKEARVVEEVSLGKQVTEREEVIHDTVRNTEVDVEQIPGTTTNQSNSATSPAGSQPTPNRK